MGAKILICGTSARKYHSKEAIGIHGLALFLVTKEVKSKPNISYISGMKRHFFRTLAQVNKAILPSFTKKGIDLSKAKKWQLALFAYRLWVTKNALDQ